MDVLRRGGVASLWRVFFAAMFALDLALGEKFRLCVVDGKGTFKRSQRYCPALDKPDSKVECIVALDRLDCLRRISKGTADFSVFTPEDLVTAQNAGIEILVTNELRLTNENQDYEVVAVVDNDSGIKTKYDLRGKRYCHPGYGYENDWTRILANFFEASVVTPTCDPKLTITENRVKDTASYFSASCKAGPWVINPSLDLQLKSIYPHLCELCGNPQRCSMHDKYWGRRGSLLCLTDGAGDVSWARLDDVDQHFGLGSREPEVPPDDYSFLCPDNTLLPLNASRPCVWVVKPWSVVASRRPVAQDIQQIVAGLSHKDQGSWRYNVRNLIQTSYTDFVNVEPVEPIESYLYRAKGYLQANSFNGCHPPRTIRICTTSIIENAKCQWLRESAAVYGIEPDLDCLKADNATHCMQALRVNAADIVMVSPDLARRAASDFDLKPLFYETVADPEKYLTVAVARPGSRFPDLESLEGKRACFPVFDGVAWNTVAYHLVNQSLTTGCPSGDTIAQFFGPSCAPGLPDGLDRNMKAICEEGFEGEFGALHCLTTGAGDVAFVSRNSIRKYLEVESEENAGSTLRAEDFQVLCLGSPSSCDLSWAPVGQAMVRANSTDLWTKDTLDVFLQLDELFGKSFKSLTNSFTLFGKFDGVSDVLFHDATQRIRDSPAVRDADKMPLSYYELLRENERCESSSAGPRAVCAVLVLLVFAHLV